MAGSMISNQPLTLKTTITTVMGTGSTFEIYETTIEVTKASIVFRNKLQLERFSVDIALGGVCTIIKRGLSNGMTKTEVVGNKKEWTSGAEGYITVLASDLLDVDNTGDKQVLTGDFEFVEDVEVKGELKSSSSLKVTGKSNPQPNFTTELERDAVYTAPLNGDKCTVAGIDYSYNSSTVQWEAKGVSTPLPDATTVIKGKARLATQAEVLAGVVTDAIVTPETLASKPAPSSFIITSDYPLGEPITDITKSCVFKETAPTFAQATTAQNIGDVAGNTRVSFPAIGTGVAGNSLKLSLAKVLSPTAFCRVRIETDNAGSPSGTLVDVNATKDIDPATLTTSLADTTVLMGANTTNAHGVTLNVNETSQTAYKGVKFTLTQQAGAVSVDKVAGCTATKAYLYDLAGNLLTSATFSTNTATLNYLGLVSGQSYYIIAGSDGSSYTSVKQTGAAAYPYIAGLLNYISGGERSVGYTNSISGSQQLSALQTGIHYIKVNAVKNTLLKSFTCRQFNSAINCVLKDNSDNILETAISGTFSGNTQLVEGNIYKIEFGVTGSSSNYYSPTPTGGTDLTYNSCGGASSSPLDSYTITTVAGNVVDTDINNIVSISTVTAISIPSGQKVHTVVSAVGDVVNPSNYYKIGYSTNDTTTRGLAKRNTTRGTATSTIFPYISSTLFHNTVLSLTDSDFAYKVDLYGIATDIGAVGSYPKVYLPVDGAIVPNFTGMTDGAVQFLSGTPGAISGTAGTNSFCVGKANSETILGMREYYNLLTLSENIKIGPSSTKNVSGNTTNTKRFQTIAPYDGYLRIKFTLTASGGSYTGGVTGRIYKNGVAYGTNRSIVSYNQVTEYTEDLLFSKGDTIELWGYYSGNTGYTGMLGALKICYDITRIYNSLIVTNPISEY